MEATKVSSALPGWHQRSVEDWRHLYQERAAIREFDGHHTRAEAERLAWSEMINRWHLAYGARVHRDICAGCRRPLRSTEALDLIDRNRVHLDDQNACLIRHGERWRAAATRALVALGLRPPIDRADIAEERAG